MCGNIQYYTNLSTKRYKGMSVRPVNNIERMSQPVLSEGLLFGKCGTTDIDLSCDWQGRYFVFVELKYGKAPLTRGQQYHLEGLVNAIKEGGRDAVAILAHHATPEEMPIIAKDSIVSRAYLGYNWDTINGDRTLLDFMSDLYKTYQLEKKR
jgi:hypothetical protein